MRYYNYGATYGIEPAGLHKIPDCFWIKRTVWSVLQVSYFISVSKLNTLVQNYNASLKLSTTVVKF